MKVKLDIENIELHINCITYLGAEKLPFVYEFNKSLKSLRKAKEDFISDLKELRESFYEEIKYSQKETQEAKKKGREIEKKYKQYLFKKEGKAVKYVRDGDGKRVEFKEGDKLTPGQFAAADVPEERHDDFKKEYDKLLKNEYEIELHQILEERFHEALQVRFNLKGEAVDSNYVEPLEKYILVEQITE